MSSVLRELLAVMHLGTGGTGHVFGGEEPITSTTFEAARRRLAKHYGAPAFTWQKLRVTCGTFLANAPGIFGAASAYREAKQLGHSVTVAEKHYLGVVHVPAEARTLEAAMGIEATLRDALGLAAKARRRAPQRFEHTLEAVLDIIEREESAAMGSKPEKKAQGSRRPGSGRTKSIVEVVTTKVGEAVTAAKTRASKAGAQWEAATANA